MRINTNTAAMNTYSNLTSANASKSSSLAKLSSGLRINKAGDDAAGLAISEKMKNQISGMTQASRNAQDGISLIQTAEGALGETHSILNRMRDLTVQSANGTNTADDKTAIQAELTSLTKEVDRIAGDTEFNTKGLMNGSEITSTSIGGNFTPAGAALTAPATNDNKLLVLAIKATNANTTLKADGTDTAGDMHTALKDLTPEKLDKIIAKYNTDKAADVSADKKLADAFDTSTVKADFDAKASKYGVTVAAGTNATDAEITTLNNAIAKAGKSELSVNDLGESRDTKFNFQIGANAGEKISVEIKNMSSKGLGVNNIDVTATNANTDDILGKLDKAIGSVSSQRADLGAVQNRLDHTVSNLATTKENLSEANSRITDVDMAEEMMSFTKSNILSQASTSMLAQANQMPQSVLSLLQ
ncbi:Flagellin-like protein [Carnobacterium sp. AT7]|uniref:flagellin N-terminal helical domain-containing protein n=1 Tax=Carnobacterium sp. AT7 TaxID=333990 RepID=UPI00015F3297|nr:flagellin [Carnobacterium sp. AT7]EDP69256.1 Flagellin-like protein [Carnobacterium sp. AT7]